ncbi:LytR family transcriptional regulator [Blastococcus sp. CT_GayMR20]|uniref:LytR C-terminal domain-containing protein n=1 Tax=Blastococcus sp. CT_GayMR20 TaxID=2559609 RepID=UPI0010741B76|nr:LytR C-terminal domain-containing protein [Blastococcus sp. CT_GayMR20]TFV88641.1 LytR family transcriptional regulator [Blastococcus sp. CT_GayMR20]TFV88663.1 LytR family transcriptional regulator [Blastococcus sp. CT_GayMR20]
MAVDDVRPSPIAAQMASAPAAPPVERRKRPRSGASVPERPRSAWHESESAFVSTGGSGLRSSGSSPRLPRQTTAAGSSAPAYGDWTKPSRSGEIPALDEAPMGPDAFDVAPGTTAIPERPVSRRRGNAVVPADGYDDESDVEMTAVRGPATGPAVGGRAAVRAERQAADAARRKAQKQRGSAVAVLEEEEGGRRSHRVIKGLVAMTIVALGVLGVYTVVSPQTTDAASNSPLSSDAAPPTVPTTDALPDLPTTPVEIEPPVAAAPVRVPVTVLNSTEVNGLAAKISETIVGAGWESPGVGAYTAGDVAASTVFFTEGDENQRQAALQLIEQFPQLQGPTPRFFELPAEVVAPGLVVVAAGDWQP